MSSLDDMVLYAAAEKEYSMHRKAVDEAGAFCPPFCGPEHRRNTTYERYTKKPHPSTLRKAY